MRVLIIAQHSISMVGGGPGVQARETARHLAEMGHEIEFFDPWKQYDLARYDLAHIFGANISTYDIAVRLKHFGMKFAVSSIFFTLHGPRFIRAARAMERLGAGMFSGIRTDYGVTAAICGLGDMVLPNTQSEARIIREGFGIPAERVRVIPNGVNERFAGADPALFSRAYGISDFVLNVGHIGSERKNVLSLIRALKNIGRPSVIIGKIHRSVYADNCLQEAARDGEITIIEGLDNDSEMLASAYAACDVFVLPSLFETPGIAALEAGLAGAKVVITKYGGTEDYFGERARYVDPFSVRSIHEGIAGSLNQTKDNRLREHILENFTWQNVALQTARAYLDIVSE